MITITDALKRTIKVIAEDKRHQWYKRTVDLAKDLIAYVTGEGLDRFLRQFVRRESEPMFEQRVIHTQHIIPSVSKILMDVAYKIPRSNSMRRVLISDDGNKLKEFNEILDKFWGTMSWDDYVSTRFIEMNYVDPNAFLVFEFSPFDEKKERLQPFPFEVESEMAIDYWYKNKILQYLLVKTDQNTLLNKEDLDRYTLYLPNLTINIDLVDWIKKDDDKETQRDFIQRINVMYNISEQLQIVFDRENIDDIDSPTEGFVQIDYNVYKIIVLKPHMLGEVPAIQYGFVPDLYTKRKMYRNPFDAAIPYMKKTIKVVSEMDLSMSLHAMPQKIAYQNRCTNCKGSGQKAEGSCPDCKGMGYQIVTTAQDSITIALPPAASPDQIIDLEKLIHYDYPPVDGLKFQDEYIDKLERKCMRVIYGNNSLRKDQVNITATESILDDSKTYDALHPFTKKYSKFWEFGIRIMAKLTEFEKDITYSMRFARDLKFLSKDDYLEQLNKADTGNANPQVKNNINAEIIKLDYSESPEMMKKYIVQNYFLPFQNLAQDERMATLSSRSRTDRERVLYESFTTIFNQLEQEQFDRGSKDGEVDGDFYMLARDKQIELVNAKVDEYIEVIKAEQPTLTLDEEIIE